MKSIQIVGILSGKHTMIDVTEARNLVEQGLPAYRLGLIYSKHRISHLIKKTAKGGAQQLFFKTSHEEVAKEVSQWIASFGYQVQWY